MRKSLSLNQLRRPHLIRGILPSSNITHAPDRHGRFRGDCAKNGLAQTFMIIRLLAAGVLAALIGTTFAQPTICPPQLRWQYSFGTAGSEEARGVIPLPDGSIVVGGDSYPFTSGGSGNRTSPNYGWQDFCLVGLDAQGEKRWDQAYGGNRNESLHAVEQTADGGFILGGQSESPASGNKTSTNHGQTDFWIVRTDASGNKLWDRSFGGVDYDFLRALKPIADGGFIVGGSSTSPPGGNKTSPRHGADDYWVLRLDADGNKIWEASFGGEKNDFLKSVQQTPDGGFVLAGYSLSDTNGNKTAVSYGGYDYWLVRLDANGNWLWDRAYGGDQSEQLAAVLVAPNGDLLLAGSSSSGVNGKRTAPRFGYEDFWVLRLDADGNEIWQAAYGGNQYQELLSAAVAGNGFVLAGWSTSPPSGSKTGAFLGNYDYWLVRIDGAGNQIWDGSFGGTSWEEAQSVAPTADGGYVVSGHSSSFNGHRTGPHFGYSDMWVLKLSPENAADCDNDGVANAQDSCAETPRGALVNSNGCSIQQICPCDGWLDHADYVACVDRASADFQSAGLITAEQRAELVGEAEDANCPRSLVLFGLVHLPIKDTTMNAGEEYVRFTQGLGPVYGASVLLGEADSGIFIDPDAGGWGWADPAWFLEGKAYDGTNGLIATIHVTKPEIEIYPVHIDLSPLGPTNLTIQFLSGQRVTREETTVDGTGSFTINTARHLHPRVNPFWRMADGSVGVLIEFNPDNDGYFDSESEPAGQERIFVRANGPSRHIDYVSRVEVAGGGGLEDFSFLDERLGMFGNRHRMLGSGLFQAANRRLTVRGGGTTIEMEETSRFEVDLTPMALTNQATLRIIAGQGTVEIASALNRLEVWADFSVPSDGTNTSSATEQVEIKVFRNGVLAGACLAQNSSVIGHLVVTNEQNPRILGCAATAGTNTSPALAFSVDQLAAFVCTNGTEIWGTHFRITPINPVELPESVSMLSLFLAGLPEFTIVAERSEIAQPRLSIAATPTQIILSWPDHTRMFQLESSSSLTEGFSPVPNDPDFINGQNSVVLPRQTTGSRFFRLAEELSPGLPDDSEAGLQPDGHLHVEAGFGAFQHYLHVIHFMMEAELNGAAAVAEGIRLVGIRGPGSDILEIRQGEGILNEHLHGISLWLRRHIVRRWFVD